MTEMYIYINLIAAFSVIGIYVILFVFNKLKPVKWWAIATSVMILLNFFVIPMVCKHYAVKKMYEIGYCQIDAYSDMGAKIKVYVPSDSPAIEANKDNDCE